MHVPNDMPVQLDRPVPKVELGSVPKPTILNTAMHIPITVRLMMSAVSLLPMRGRLKFAANASLFICNEYPFPIKTVPACGLFPVV